MGHHGVMLSSREGGTAPSITNEVRVAIRILGSEVGAQLVRFLATLPNPRAGAYWREIADALPGYAATSLRRHLAELEDAGVIAVEAPSNAERGNRRGAAVKYRLDEPRLEEVLAGTREWLLGGARPDVQL